MSTMKGRRVGTTRRMALGPLLPLILLGMTLLVAFIQPSSASTDSTSTEAHSLIRDSIHAGERATKERFQSMASRVGIETHPHQPHPHHQSHQHQHEEQVMLDIVEKVLDHSSHPTITHATQETARDGTHAEAIEEEFHLLNALMEKQSEMREYSEESNEQNNIAGISRQFLKKIADEAIHNALHKVHMEHPGVPLRTSDPVHLYGVRSPYNGPKKSHHVDALHTEEALEDPYLQRNSFIEPVAEATAFADHLRPQVVYRLGKHDNSLLAEREVVRNQQYQASHQHANQKHQRQHTKPTGAAASSQHHRSPQHEARRNSPTPKPQPQAKRVVEKRAAQSVQGQMRKQQTIPLAATKPVQQKRDPYKVKPTAFLEVDTQFESLHAAYLRELDAHDTKNEGHPWFRMHEDGSVDDSPTARAPLEELFQKFTPTTNEDELDTGFVELESSVDESGPLRELGILLGLNPNKKNEAHEEPKPQQAAQPAKADDSVMAKVLAQQQKSKDATTKPSTTGLKPTAAPVTNQKHSDPAHPTTTHHSFVEHKARDDGDDGGGDDLQAMVNAGDEYTPSSLKHPPPPPVPPPPPPPPPPKFEAGGGGGGE